MNYINKENKVKNIKKKEKKKEKKKINWKIISLFIVFQLVFTAVTGPFLLFYGPFEVAKRGFVATANQTYTVGKFLRIFLSEDEIKKILNADQPVDDSVFSEQTVEIDVNKEKDYEINQLDLKFDGATGYVLEIANPKRIKIGLTEDLGNAGEKTSEIAEKAGADAAVNGGGFYDASGNSTRFAGTGGTPTGLVIKDGEIIHAESGSDHKRVCFAMTKEGKMLVGKYSANELIKREVTQALSFGDESILVKDGKVVNGNTSGNNPRTAIGQRKDGSIVMVVIDGRDFEKMELGVSLNEVAVAMKNKLDVVNAFNLDGGKSTTMYYDGEVINNPSESTGERSIPTAVMVMPEE